jgi:hypothetical protein
MDLAFKYYEQALAINPRHRGAHEYVGEAYLMVEQSGQGREAFGGAGQALLLFRARSTTDLNVLSGAYKSTTAKTK